MSISLRIDRDDCNIDFEPEYHTYPAPAPGEVPGA